MMRKLKEAKIITILTKMLKEIKEYDQAIEYFKILIDLQKNGLGPEAVKTFISINDLGLIYYYVNDFERLNCYL